jgi:hypothetical protein
MPWVIRLVRRSPGTAGGPGTPRRSAAPTRRTHPGRERIPPGWCRGTQPAPASARQSVPEQPECGAAVGGPSPCGRGDPRPPGGGEGSQVGHLQAAGREIISEPPGVAAGRFPGALAHNGVRQRPGDRQPPDRLPGDAQPPGELRGGQEVRGLLRFRWRGPSWCRDERRGQGPGQCLQQLGWDWLVCVVVVIYRVRFDLPRAFRTADLWLIHAADCCSRYSLWTCCGVRY